MEEHFKTRQRKRAKKAPLFLYFDEKSLENENEKESFFALLFRELFCG